MTTFEFTWEVEDGYAGASRPQTSTMDLSDFEGCENTGDVAITIEELVQEDFNRRISWYGEVGEMAEKIMKALKEQPDA